VGHNQIEQHHVGVALMQQLEGAGTVSGLYDSISAGREGKLPCEELQRLWFVVHEKDVSDAVA
jgi:hypothetical protein